ncbi:MAG TPA: glycosyltransferase family 4 protein [Gaiellaceae bacterium]|nr:glycosyltransferase family 4 protein [Gaiellaceae bacterium]
MKVVYVSTLERGGPLTHVKQLAPRVAAEGVDVQVLCGSEAVATSVRELGLQAEAVPVAHKLDVLGGGRALWRKLDGADVVHTHDRRAGLFGRLAGRLRGARVVHTLHGMPEEIAARVGRPDAPEPPGVSRGRIVWLEHGYLPLEAGLTRLGHVVAPSRAMADFMLDHGFSPRLLHVIPYGIEPGNGVAEPQERDLLVAGVAANLEYWKGVDVLLEAARLVQAPLRLEIYGVGSLADELQRRAHGVDARFHGFAPDMPARLVQVDVLVQPSRADNLPLSILEAMAAGLPVVGTRVGGIPELVVDGETGLVVEPEDPAALAAALDALAAAPEWRRELGRRGRERVAEHFSAEGIARRTVALYEDLCASST